MTLRKIGVKLSHWNKKIDAVSWSKSVEIFSSRLFSIKNLEPIETKNQEIKILIFFNYHLFFLSGVSDKKIWKFFLSSHSFKLS